MALLFGGRCLCQTGAGQSLGAKEVAFFSCELTSRAAAYTGFAVAVAAGGQWIGDGQFSGSVRDRFYHPMNLLRSSADVGTGPG